MHPGNSCGLSLRQDRPLASPRLAKIELIHAPPVVVDCVRRVANEVNGLSEENDSFETPSKDKRGCLKLVTINCYNVTTLQHLFVVTNTVTTFISCNSICYNK